MFEIVYFLKQEAPSRRSENRKYHKSRKVKSKKALANLKQKLWLSFKSIVAKNHRTLESFFFIIMEK